jgi:hypothetical protein
MHISSCFSSHHVEGAYNDFQHKTMAPRGVVGVLYNTGVNLKSYDTSVFLRGGKVSTGPLKGLAQGFFVMATAIWLFSVAALVRSGDPWLGLLYFLIWLIPVSGAGYLWLRGRKFSGVKPGSGERLRKAVLSLQGVALACWAFDLATTFYAIDIARVATEINPLGWPLGAVGALVYYAPTVILTHVLLFRIRQKVALYAAIPITAVMLLMGAMNLNAGMLNFRFFISSAMLPAGTRISLLAAVLLADVICASAFATSLLRQTVRSREKLGTKSSPIR